jgi:hypothetical protein
MSKEKSFLSYPFSLHGEDITWDIRFSDEISLIITKYYINSCPGYLD